MSSVLILLAGIAAIVAVNWYFFNAPKLAAAASTAMDGVQEVDITVQGGYSPQVVRVKKGSRTRLVFDRQEKSPCSEEVVISDFGVRQFLRPFEQTVVEIEPLEVGSYEFACGMNMLRGRIEVEA